MKKTIRIMTAAVMISMIFINCQPGFAEELSENEVIQIQSAQDLLLFAEQVNNGDTAINAELVNDIDLSEICSETAGSWIPIDDYEGTFDGNGHVISGLYCAGTESRAALFDFISSSSEIKNIIMEDVYVEGSKYAAGIVANGWGTVSGCSVSGYVKGGEYAAGVCAVTGSVFDCVNYADVICDDGDDDNFTNGRCGGVAGQIDGWAENCINYGTVTGAEWVTAGVIGGTPKSSMQNIQRIENCFNYGTVEGYLDTGGIAGFVYNTVIQHCGNNADVTGMAYVGGIVCSTAENKDGSLIINCYNKGNIIGKDWGEGVDAIVIDSFYDFISDQRAGGIASGMDNCHICNCYSWGSVQSQAPHISSTIAGIAASGDYTGYISNSYANVSFVSASGDDPDGIGLCNDYCDNCFFLNGLQRPTRMGTAGEPGQSESWFYDGTVTSRLNEWPTPETDSSISDYLNQFGAEADEWVQGENGPVFVWEDSEETAE